MATKKQDTTVERNGNGLVAKAIVGEQEFDNPFLDPPTRAWWDNAIKSTEFSRNEAAVVQWLRSDDPAGFPELRQRFEHRLHGVDDITLAKVSALMAEFIDAIVANDRQALERGAGCWDEYFGLRCNPERILPVYMEWKWLVRELRRDPTALRTNPEEFAGDIDIFRVAAAIYDPKFSTLDDATVLNTVSRIRRNSRGGRHNLNVRGALAELVFACRAFGFTSAKAAKKEIDKVAKAYEDDAQEPKTSA